MRVGDYRLTPEGVDRWSSAQRALARVPNDAAFTPIRAADPSDADVSRVVAYLDSHPDSRRAIEQSGLSVRDYVLTALALARAEAAQRAPTAAEAGDQNLLLFRTRRADIVRARRASRFHVIDVGDDDERGQADGDDDGRRRHRHRRGHERDDDEHDEPETFR